MCRMGIFFDEAAAKSVLDSGFLNQRDGAGIYSASKQILIKHEELDADSFVPLVKKDVMPLMVHARQASVGASKMTENCQPFKVGKKVFAHNGTIAKDPFLPENLSIENPECLQKLLDFYFSSDSRLLAQSLASLSIQEADEKLNGLSEGNNFFFYSEEEKKFLVKGVFQILYSKPGVARLAVAGTGCEKIARAFRFKGTAVINVDGTIVLRRMNPIRDESMEEPSWLRQCRMQDQPSSLLPQPSLFG